jgi:hypothetical protein
MSGGGVEGGGKGSSSASVRLGAAYLLRSWGICQGNPVWKHRGLVAARCAQHSLPTKTAAIPDVLGYDAHSLFDSAGLENRRDSGPNAGNALQSVEQRGDEIAIKVENSKKFDLKQPHLSAQD